MIITQLIGGMGNQMFQYALGRRLAHDRGVPLKLDVTWYETSANRTYRLSHLNVDAELATPAEINRYVGKRIDQKLLRLIERRTVPFGRRRLVKERVRHYDPAILNAPRHAYLEAGYWQTERYFQPIEAIIRREFAFKTTPDAANISLCELIQRVNAISLHVRRGDYATDTTTNRFHGLTPLKYYHEAAQRIIHAVKSPHFFVFSDDMAWVKANLRIDQPVTYVEVNDAAKDYEDLRLMSLCKHHIIANSSFSWWGAWLAASPDQLVFAPERWGNDPALNHPDRIPTGWQRI